MPTLPTSPANPLAFILWPKRLCGIRDRLPAVCLPFGNQRFVWLWRQAVGSSSDPLPSSSPGTVDANEDHAPHTHASAWALLATVQMPWVVLPVVMPCGRAQDGAAGTLTLALRLVGPARRGNGSSSGRPGWAMHAGFPLSDLCRFAFEGAFRRFINEVRVVKQAAMRQ